MTSLRPLCVLAIALALPLRVEAQTEAAGASPLYDFVLDYSVPTSPAFTILDVAPSAPATGSAAKPIVVSVLNQFLTDDHLEPGLAVDVVPYVVLGGGVQSLEAYLESPLLQIAASTQFSLGTVQVEESESIRLAWGLRSSLYDARDLLRNDPLAHELQRRLGACLIPEEDGPIVGDEEAEGEDDTLACRMAAYDDITAQARRKKGIAVAIGAGQAFLFRSATVSSDSVEVTSTHAWAAGQWYTGAGFDVLGTLQGRLGADFKDDLRIGIGFQGGASSVEASGEVAYSTAASRFHYGLGATLPLVGQVRVALGIGTTSDPFDTEAAPKLRLTTRLLYGLSGS